MARVKRKPDKSSPPAIARHYLALCSIFRDEAVWLREWIEFHRAVGVEHFLLYDNGSTDDYLRALQHYGPDLVTVVDWPDNEVEVGRQGWVRASQRRAYADGVRRMRGRCDWLGIVDGDEFLVPVRYPDLPTLLRRFEEYGGVVLNWVCFGTSGVWDLGEDALLIERLCRRSPTQAPDNHKVKSIVRPQRVSGDYHVHAFEYLDGHFAVNATGARHGGGPRTDRVQADLARIHHYKNRTVRYFLEQKVGKKEHMSGLKLGPADVRMRMQAHDEVEDFSMRQFVPVVRERLVELSRRDAASAHSPSSPGSADHASGAHAQ